MPARILVADDDFFVRAMVAEFLRGVGYEVIEAENAEEAMALFKSSGHIDLVFSDIKMPGQMDGCGLAREIRVQWPQTQIILTSGYSDVDPYEDPRNLFLAKPYRPLSVLAAISSLVG